jgi:pimeloyl-ACP methyl ester carboxylesterase
VNATDQRPEHTGVRPTIVLVHGAFADASGWNGVIERLQQQGYTVIAPANPLRGVVFDSAYTASLLGQIDGPVLLAGHSYGGAVITNAATSAPNVAGLAFVAAFAPDEGERLGEATSDSKDSILNTALVQYHYPAGPDGDTSVEFAINPALLREAFAADLPRAADRADGCYPAPRRRGGVQRRASGPPAWRRLPSWAVVATGDKAAGADVVRAMAQRAGADIVEVEGSHVIMISQPQAVTDHILKAARAVAGSHR